MYSRQQRPAKTSANHDDTPASNQFAPRPFVVQPKAEEVKPQPEKTPDSQTETAQEKQYDSDFPDAAIFTRHLTPPKLPGIQMKLNKELLAAEKAKAAAAINAVQQITTPQNPSVQREGMATEQEPQNQPFADTLQRREQTAEKENNTGMPDSLKAGVENLSGISMDDVKVHYNSAKPTEMQALAYTQGTDIHVGPGQEKYLPHEAWHVVQQKQGRVQPTLQAKGKEINDEQGLEKEADLMGQQALVTINSNTGKNTQSTPNINFVQPKSSVIQCYSCTASYLVGLFSKNNVAELKQDIGEEAFRVFLKLETSVLEPLADSFKGQSPILNAAEQVQFLSPHAHNTKELKLAEKVLANEGIDVAAAQPVLNYLLPYLNNDAHLLYAEQVLTEATKDIATAKVKMAYYQPYLDDKAVLDVSREVLTEKGDIAAATMEMDALKAYKYDRTLKKQVESAADTKVQDELDQKITTLNQQKTEATIKYPSLSASDAKQELLKDDKLRQELGLGSVSASQLGRQGRDAMNKKRDEIAANVDKDINNLQSGKDKQVKDETKNITALVTPLLTYNQGPEMAKWALTQSGTDTEKLKTLVSYMHSALQKGFDATQAQTVASDLLPHEVKTAGKVINAYNRSPSDWDEVKKLLTTSKHIDIAFALTKSSGQDVDYLKKLLDILELSDVTHTNLEELLKLESQPETLKEDLTLRQKDPSKLAILLSKVQNGPVNAPQIDRNKIDELMAVDQGFHTHKLIKLGVKAQKLIDTIDADLTAKQLANITAAEKDPTDANEATQLIDYANTNKSHIKVLLVDRKRDEGIVKRLKKENFTTTQIEELSRFETAGSAPVENKYARLDHFALRHTYKHFVFNSSNYDATQGMWPVNTDATQLKKYVDDALTNAGLNSANSHTWADGVYNPVNTGAYNAFMRIADWGGNKKITQFYPQVQGGIRTFTQAEVAAFENVLKKP